MAWIQKVRRADGTVTRWIRDRRDGQQIVIPAGESDDEAETILEQYLIRRDLEKEGYDDGFESSQNQGGTIWVK